jgi:hypothetical protein
MSNRKLCLPRWCALLLAAALAAGCTSEETYTWEGWYPGYPDPAGGVVIQPLPPYRPSCTPHELAACLDGSGIRCNGSGDGYDITPCDPDCADCEPPDESAPAPSYPDASPASED